MTRRHRHNHESEILYAVAADIPDGTSNLPRGEWKSRYRAYTRAALAVSAGLAGAPPGPFDKKEDGAPLPFSGWRWSVSDTIGRALSVVARIPVGVDVEQLRSPRPELARKVADGREWELLGGCDDMLFARMFSAKEAALKSTGKGIGGLSRCRLTLPSPAPGRLILEYEGNRYFVDQMVENGYVHSLACPVPDARVRWIRCCLWPDPGSEKTGDRSRCAPLFP
ncbi:MAG: 4'-phosphopantetheinyl transferase family protein [Desulfatibacillaceae bacterium]